MSDADLGLTVLVVGLIAIGLLIWWLSARAGQNKHAKHLDKLRAIAQPAGGHVVIGEHESVPRSAALRPVFPSLEDASQGWHFRIVRPPRYEYAMSLWRGRWYARVAQASVVTQSLGGTTHHPTTRNAYRIEVELAPCPALKLSPVLQIGVSKTVLVPDEHNLPVPPSSGGQAAQSNADQWAQVSLPAPYSERLRVFTADHGFVMSVLNEASLEWLVTHMPTLRAGINIEQGLLHVNMSDNLDADTILNHIDVLIGFLERTPIEPPQPSGA